MKYSKASLRLIIALVTMALFAGCATQKEDRRLQMPTWFEGYDEDEKAEDQAAKEETQQPDTMAPESAADASDRISDPVSDPITTKDEETTTAADPTNITDAPSDTSAAETSAAAIPAQDTTTIKLSPRPKKLTAADEKQALQAQQATPRYQIALQKLKAGELENALLLFQELSAQFPSLSGPVLNQAIILRKQGKLKDAKSLLQQQLLNKVQNPYLMTELGIVNRELGNFEAAKQAYLAAIRMEPNYDKAHYNLSLIHI